MVVEMPFIFWNFSTEVLIHAVIVLLIIEKL